MAVAWGLAVSARMAVLARAAVGDPLAVPFVEEPASVRYGHPRRGPRLLAVPLNHDGLSLALERRTGGLKHPHDLEPELGVRARGATGGDRRTEVRELEAEWLSGL